MGYLNVKIFWKEVGFDIGILIFRFGLSWENKKGIIGCIVKY